MVQSAGPVSNNGPPSTKIKEVEWKNEAMVAAVFDGAEVCRECVAYFCVLRQLLFFLPSQLPVPLKVSRKRKGVQAKNRAASRRRRRRHYTNVEPEVVCHVCQPRKLSCAAYATRVSVHF